jgi:hypothetical protein
MPQERDPKKRERRDRAIVRMYSDGIKLSIIAHRRKNVPAIVRLHKRYSKAWPIVTPYCSTA